MTGVGTDARWRSIAIAVFALAGACLVQTAHEQGWAMKLGLHPDARAALALHCDERSAGERRDCRAYLRDQFARDERHAQAIIRLHCTRYETVWESAPLAPAPPVCAERFGGWLGG